jgi:hypothetical protein
MNIFQVWVGDRIPLCCQNLMVQNIQMGEYTLISEHNFINAPNWIDVVSYCNTINLNYNDYTTVSDKVLLSEYIRFHYLSEHSTFYIDSDAQILTLPNVTSGGFFVTQCEPWHDYYAIINNNANELFYNFYQRMKIVLATDHNNHASTIFKLLNEEYQNIFKTFNYKLIKHLNLRMWHTAYV